MPTKKKTGAPRPRTIFKSYRDGLDAFAIVEYHVVGGREIPYGPVAVFDTPDGDPACVARAENYLRFLNARADEWPYAREGAGPTARDWR